MHSGGRPAHPTAYRCYNNSRPSLVAHRRHELSKTDTKCPRDRSPTRWPNTGGCPLVTRPLYVPHARPQSYGEPMRFIRAFLIAAFVLAMAANVTAGIPASAASETSSPDVSSDPNMSSAEETMSFAELVEVSRERRDVTIDVESGRHYSGPGIVVTYTLPSQMACRVYYHASDPARDQDPRGTYTVNALSEVIVASQCSSSVTWRPVLAFFDRPGGWSRRDAGGRETTPPGRRDTGFVLDSCRRSSNLYGWRNRINKGGAAAVRNLRCR